MEFQKLLNIFLKKMVKIFSEYLVYNIDIIHITIL